MAEASNNETNLLYVLYRLVLRQILFLCLTVHLAEQGCAHYNSVAVTLCGHC